jgi:FkbM family methyltransferase
MRTLVKKAISGLGYELRRSDEKRPLPYLDFLSFLKSDPATDGDLLKFMRFACHNAPISNSQIFQDLFVLQVLNEKRNGYFVEFGATDGVFLSNSFLLERDYGWRGIVAEPSINWHDALKRNRNCSVDTRCVWDKTGETLNFAQTDNAEYSAVTSLGATDYHGRSVTKEYGVKTISLNDLLEEHKAPREIDYLSIDTEGAELKILRALDFKRWSFATITVEHNYDPDHREGIFSLMTSYGYKRILSEVSHWDDWYVPSAAR